MRPTFAAVPAFVDITWMSISNMYYEIGPLNIVTDGYITRLPQDAFFGGGGGYAQTRQAVYARRCSRHACDECAQPAYQSEPVAHGAQSLGSLVRHGDVVEADGRSHHRLEDDMPAGAGGGRAG